MSGGPNCSNIGMPSWLQLRVPQSLNYNKRNWTKTISQIEIVPIIKYKKRELLAFWEKEMQFSQSIFRISWCVDGMFIVISLPAIPKSKAFWDLGSLFPGLRTHHLIPVANSARPRENQGEKWSTGKIFHAALKPFRVIHILVERRRLLRCQLHSARLHIRKENIDDHNE